ncbi:MAG: TMEM43 family protein [Geminicoccaceae bacterium]
MGRFVKLTLLLFGAVFAAYWAVYLLRNEWRLGARLQALGAAAQSVVEADPARVDPENDGRFVHLVGSASGGPVRDPVLNVGGTGLRLDRTAETYQWVEDKDANHDRVVRYEQQWRTDRVPSERFDRRTEHHNPDPLPLASASFAPAALRIDAYEVDPAVIAALPATAGLRPEAVGQVIFGGRPMSVEGPWLQSGDPARPGTGDIRVRLALVPEGTISVVARQEGRRLVPWPAADGSPIGLAAPGEVAADRLTKGEARDNWGEAWRNRLTGTLGVLMGMLFVGMTQADRFGPLRELPPLRRLGVVALAAIGLAAILCAAGWIGARMTAT